MSPESRIPTADRGSTPKPQVSATHCQLREPAHTAHLTWTVITSRDELVKLEPAWSELCGPTGETQAPAWVLTWLETLGRDARPFVLVARDNAQCLRAVLALAHTPNSSITELAGAGHGGVHGDVAVHPGFEQAVRRGLETLLVTSPLRRLRLRRLSLDGALASWLSRAVLPGFARPRLSAAAPAIVGFESWDAFLAHLTKHRRHEARRHLRRFHEIPGAAVRWITDPDDVEPALRMLFELHEKRFAAQRRSTSFRGDAVFAFHLRYARRLQQEGRLLLGVLETAERPVAAAYGWHRAGRTTLFQMGIDPTAQRLAPGIVLAAHVLRDQVIGAGKEALDFGEGCYEWKLGWANEVRHLVDIEAYGPGPWGRARRFLASINTALRSIASTRVCGRRCHGQVTATPPKRTRCNRAGCSAPRSRH